MDAKELRKLKKFSAQLRIDQLEMFKQRGMGHIGGCLSVTELISVLYGIQMKVDPKNPNWEGRDYLVMSKGHAAPAVEAALAELGFFDKKLLLTMDDIGTRIPSHVDRLLTPGIDVTCGSLGQGASVAAGIVYGLKHAGITDQYVYVCIGDGELNEGQNWEAFQFMAHNKLNNCIVFIDNNKRQHDGYCDEVLKPFSYEEKMKAFGFWCKTVDGASEEAIDDGINEAKAVKDQAVCIVLDTIKGQGVKYYEEMPDNHAPKVFEEGRAVIACCPLECLEEHVHRLEQLGIEMLHVDIMDGNFVANYCLGTEFIPLLHRITKLPLDIHLMIQRPDQKLSFIPFESGDYVTIHAESTPHIQKTLAEIRRRGAKAGLALNPATPLDYCRWMLPDIDLLLVMTINPGFAGQKLVPQTLDKIRCAKELLERAGSTVLIETDGNVSFINAEKMRRAGTNIFVAGTSSLYTKEGTLEENYRKLRCAIAQGEEHTK